MTAVQPARKTVLRQAIADMSYHWCPVTANLPSKMTEAGFRAACDGFYEKATLQRGPAKFQAKKYAVCLDCMGKTMPKGLEIISLNDLQTEIMEENMEATQRNDICEVCEQKKLGLKPAYGHQACSSCRILMTSVKKRPESVIKYMQEVHGDKYFSTATPVDPDNDQQWARGVIQAIRHALGIADGEDVEDLAGRVEILVREKKAASGPVGTFAEQQQRLDRFRAEIDTLTSANNDLAARNIELQEEADRLVASRVEIEKNYGTMARKMKDLLADNAEQADIIKSLTSLDQSLLPEDISETGADIVIKCDMLKKMLLEKNKSYGDSAMNPVRVFSRADPGEQLLVRIDDKLSRLSKGKEFAGDDTIMDLIGYMVLLLVYRDRPADLMQAAA